MQEEVLEHGGGEEPSALASLGPSGAQATDGLSDVLFSVAWEGCLVVSEMMGNVSGQVLV